MKITKKVQTRLFLKYDIEQGDRQIKKYRTGRWKSWDRREVMLDNVREAVKYVTDKMQKEHIGGIVVIRPVVNGRSLPNYSKIYQAKYSPTSGEFIQFDGIAGDYWKRKLNT